MPNRPESSTPTSSVSLSSAILPKFSNSPLFAVLIGIDTYRLDIFPPLRGAVADAIGFNEYLDKNLGIPSNQITVLTNENATRSAIIDALKNLGEDKRIQTGDSILIYFAGYGTEMDSPAERRLGLQTKMQAIVPYDCEIDNNSKMWNVPPIPDIVFAALLERIASQNGDNITVVFDCSYASSGTRGTTEISDVDVRIRSLEVPALVYVESVDQDILHKETRFLLSNRTPDFGPLRSHVVLTACSYLELAREKDGHGIFTTSLLKLLTQLPPDRLRYSDIPLLLEHIPRQNPQIEGRSLNRFLFNGKVLTQRPEAFLISLGYVNNGIPQYYVHAGTTHGITLDSAFVIYRMNDFSLTHQLGILHVDKLHTFFFTAKLPDGALAVDLSQPTIAIADKEPKEKICLNIHIPRNNDFLHVYREVEKANKSIFNLDNVYLVDETQNSHVEIMLTDEKKLSITIQSISGHKFNHSIEDLQILPWFLSRMAHFYRELDLPKTLEETSLNSSDSAHLRYGDIGVELYQLREIATVAEATGFLDEKLEPLDHNLYINGKIDLVVADQYGYSIPYGLKLVNKSGLDFYTNLFFFTNSDLSISPCIELSRNRGTSIPLQRQSDLKIGYGSEGYPPICFGITDGYDVDIEFLKIYLSTQPIDLDFLIQPSPFVKASDVTQHYTPTPRVPLIEIVIPITQTRY